jgi:hypothetical protein
MASSEITLTVGGDSVTIKAPALGVDVQQIIPSVVVPLAGGNVARYQTGDPRFEATIQCDVPTDTLKDSVEQFIRDHWRDDITYTEEGGATRTVQLLDSSIPWIKNQKGDWVVTLRMNMSAMLN